MLFLLVCAVMVPGASASAGLSFASSSSVAVGESASPDLTAGSHPYALTTAYKLKTTVNAEGELVAEGGDLKELVTEFPAGVIVNPMAATRCGSPEFTTVNFTTEEDGCPNASAVGVVAIEYTTSATPSTPQTVESPIYDLTPPPGSPALFGIQVAGTPVYLSPTIRVGGDYGLSATLKDIPQVVHVLGGTLTLWGVPADSSHDTRRGTCVESHSTCPAGIASKALIDLPTQCLTSPVVLLRASSWQEPEAFTATASDPLLGGPSALTECQALDFSPTLSVQAVSSVADSPTGLTIKVHLPQSESPAELAEAGLREALVTLPPGMALNLSSASGVVGCPLEGPEGVDLGSAEPGHCSAASKIGTVKIDELGLGDELTGGIYLAQQGNLAGGGVNSFGSLLAFYIVAEGEGVVLKLPVEVAASETGQLSMRLGPDPSTKQSFVPQLPMEDVTLEFDGGAQAILATPTTCATQTIGASLTPWNSAPPATATAEFQTSENCANAFNPAFAAQPTNPEAGAYSPLTFSLARADGEQELKSVSVTLPTGMLAMVGSVQMCPEPQASLGTCGQASLVGEATLSVGVGPTPLTITGAKVYFTGPYGGGPFGLSIVVPAAIGPFDLGAQGRPVVVRAAIGVGRSTGQITIATDPAGAFAIPSLLEGMPLQIRSLTVNINRPEFTFNSTSCARLAIDGVATSTQNTAAALSTSFQSVNCSALPFGPKLTASVVGKPSRIDGIGMNTTIVEGYTHEANAHYVKVELPKQLPARITTLRNACPAKVFEANPAGCPPGSTVGTVETVTSALPVPLVGPAYLVSNGNAKFPELVFVLQGYGVIVEVRGDTFIDKDGVASATFPDVPEAPIPSFQLHLPQGPGSLLTTAGKLCGEDLRMVTTIVAYNGLAVKESPQITVPGCRPVIKVLRHRIRGRTLTMMVSVPSAGRLVASAKGFGRKSRSTKAAGTVTIKLPLPKSARVSGHRHLRSGRVVVKLTFIQGHGVKLTTRLAVVVR
ncbi:MAG: hypothetical protein ABSH36_11960 [Solirubrobacteraceae bacterium]